MSSEILDVVKAVQAVEAVEKFLETFFSAADVWRYEAISDDKACPRCLYYEQIGAFSGDMLRQTFPYLETLDENTIAPNVHPNCRCRLHRGYS
jgi:hypothetical protein